jgi:branched-chain amino acid transport system permease protein
MRLARKGLGFIALPVLLLLYPLSASNEYELRLFMLFMVYAIIALGLNVLVGLAGLVSLGQAGLFALGAYTASILATKAGAGLIACCIGSAAFASTFGVLLAYPTVRVKGVYLAVITIAFGLIVENVAIEWQSLTGGTTGISGIPRPSILGFKLSGYQYYYFIAAIVLAVLLFTRNIQHSRFGRAMLAVAQSETASKSAGINATAIRTLAFVIAAGTAGLAGSLYAFLNSYISPDIFTFSDSVRFLLMVILGGAGTVLGPVLGAYILTYLPEFLQQFQYWQAFAYGFLLAAVMFVMPRGVIGTLLNARQARQAPQADNAGPNCLSQNSVEMPNRTARGDGLEAIDLTVRFGGLVALSSVSLRVSPGQVHGLIGPNGAGKSTFVNTITGFYRPAAGSFRLDGTDLTNSSPHRIARLGLARTFQNTELFKDMTVIENVMAGYHQKLSYSVADAAMRTPRFIREQALSRTEAARLLNLTGLTNYTNLKARFLPFGLQRRLEIARALAQGPRLLLLDEPAAGLTAGEVANLSEMIRKIAASGISILIIEHHVELVMSVASAITVLDYGQVIARGTPAEVQSDARVIEAYFGTAQTEQALAGGVA